MRSHALVTTLRVVGALFGGCGLATLEGCVEPRRITAAYGVEVPARERGYGPARDFVGEVRLGYGLDMNGKVPPGFGASRFAVGDPIHLSLWEVTGRQAGSVVRVSVLDATDRVVWSEDKEAPRGGSYLTFGIGRALVRGRYRAEVIVDREVRSRTGFEVFAWQER